MTKFELALSESLEALSQGRWDVDECLRRYPEHAIELRPLVLAAAAATATLGQVQPGEEFATAARERFLIATGQRLEEALDNDPTPTFFASARVRFLMAAQRMKLGERHRTGEGRRLPSFGTPFRVLAGGLAVLAILLGFSAYTVNSAEAALPGDWDYNVKLQTERVRLALTFSEAAERRIKLDIASERVDEIEAMAERGRTIGPGVIGRLVDQTGPLVDDAVEGDLDAEEARRLQELTSRQQAVLDDVEPRVAPEAQAKLDEAGEVARTGVEASTRIIVSDPASPPVVITPVLPLQTPSPDPGTPEIFVTPTAPPAVTTETAVPPATPTPSLPVPGLNVGSESSASRDNMKLYPVAADRVSLLMPGPEDGWFLTNSPAQGVPTLLRFTNVDGTSLVSVNTMNGDVYWFIFRAGRYDEVQLRITRDSTVLVPDRAVILGAYGVAAVVPLYIADSVEVIPAPTPTSEPTSDPTTTP